MDDDAFDMSFSLLRGRARPMGGGRHDRGRHGRQCVFAVRPVSVGEAGSADLFHPLHDRRRPKSTLRVRPAGGHGAAGGAYEVDVFGADHLGGCTVADGGDREPREACAGGVEAPLERKVELPREAVEPADRARNDRETSGALTRSRP
jgi:hypothetical protein